MSNADETERILEHEVVGVSEPHYGDKYHEHFMTLYRDYVSSAHDISRRRQTANTFFLTINTALFGLMDVKKGFIDGELVWMVSLAAIVFCIAWQAMINSYASLNSAKFAVINEIEKRLPLRPYWAEWQVKAAREGDTKSTLTRVEKNIPYIFIALHVIAIVTRALFPPAT